MSLLSRLREKQAGKVATATPATFATQAAGERRTVASVATVTVAKSPQGQTASPAEVGVTEGNPCGTGDTATVSRWWLIHYLDRDPVEVACCPDATHADILERHPDAVAAEPFAPTIRRPSAPLTTEDEAAIRAWLAQIEETDPAIIAEVIGQCQRDADARGYFTGRAAADNSQKNRGDAADDDRRTCDQCANLIARRCHAAKRGEIVASRNYEPIRDLPRRCEGYAPGADDPDRRHGRERWPGLIQKGVE
ncbi:MAG: hypothetical protein I8H71_04985 [Xanthomonadaceae bacterium]|nr:hypothetical protein [Xanthomonadaceae bacterium]